MKTPGDLQKAYGLLTGLKLILAKVGKDTTTVQAAIQKQVKYYATLDPRMLDIALDCIMALSKITISLKTYYQSEITKTTTTVASAKLNKDINDLRDQMNLLTEFFDQLIGSMCLSRGDQTTGLAERAKKIMVNMREIGIEMA
jgi:hypothetical protein